MLLDWSIYGVFVWSLATTLNAVFFKQQPVSRFSAWLLTSVIFFISLVAMTVIQVLRYKVISQDLGYTIRPNGPVDAVGAFTFSWLFFSLLCKNKTNQDQAKTAQSLFVTPSVSGSSKKSIETENSASPSAIGGKIPKIVEKPTTAPAENFWSEALTEFDSKLRRPGLWARSFSEAQGNESLAKANYLRSRAYEIELERLEQIAESKRVAKQKAKKNEFLHLSPEERTYALLPKGICPNCSAVVLMTSKICPKCTAMFGLGSGWNPAPLTEN